ncbi:Response regulator receiver protein (modular protein) [Verrucomicrobia bacterium]|nr:Response regulator receiver protein (modular protein) [Verrucomicrobiota bacterium]
MSPIKAVLVIDDDPDFRKLMVLLLRQHDWAVLEASEGDEGIRLAKTHRPQVVLCDLLMPRCNGFQVCRALRLDESLRHTRVIVTSGRHFESDRQAAFTAGADEYLTKPIDPPHLLQLMARLVSPQEETQPAVAQTSPATTRLTFWGVRGSIPTPGPSTVRYGGNTSCIEVRTDGQIIILDAGTGLRLLGRQLVAEFDDQPLDLTLLLTHTHWDHIQGLPYFLPVYKPCNQLRILGFEGARHGLENILTSQMESPFFPIGLREVPANVRIEELKDLNFSVGAVRVQAGFANHPGICVGYRLFTSGGSIAFFPDNEPHTSLHRGSGENATAAASAHGENQKLIEFLQGTDVLIMDSQYDGQEYQEHIGWGHGCVDDVVGLAIEAGVKRLFLFHHDPNHDDAKIEQMVQQARQLVSGRHASLSVEAAREGATVELP